MSVNGLGELKKTYLCMCKEDIDIYLAQGKMSGAWYLSAIHLDTVLINAYLREGDDVDVAQKILGKTNLKFRKLGGEFDKCSWGWDYV